MKVAPQKPASPKFRSDDPDYGPDCLAALRDIYLDAKQSGGVQEFLDAAVSAGWTPEGIADAIVTIERQQAQAFSAFK